MVALENQLRECAAELAEHDIMILGPAFGRFFLLIQLRVDLLKLSAFAVVEPAAEVVSIAS